MYKNHKIAAIIAAAGSSKRMGSGINKQYIKIGNQTVIVRSIMAFSEDPTFDEIIVVIREDEMDFFKTEFIGKGLFSKKIILASGGAERQDSVYNAIKMLGEDIDIVLIHDGARPLIGQETINQVISKTVEMGAAAPGVAVKDTIKIVDADLISETPDRSSMVSIQTPQGFKKDIIVRAFEKAFEDGYYGNDETVLLERIKEKVYIVRGDYSNIKITTMEDVAICKALLSMRNKDQGSEKEMRVGNGFDVHAFVENRKLILGGVEIPFEKGLLGHSDADVLLHAIMDALLGACGLADIGRYFPDTDEDYRGISSLLLLEKVGDLIGSEGFEIINIDAVVIAQRPKIAPYINQMIKHIAQVLKISEDRINIKGTTTEGLGFVGREEGIAVTAIVAVEK
jgi:2-C-methyl-D-erythritol 4-phosphate cytidylyltransferase/2-C-methyl-D-erythritol 2,4-cyclodiphosphate synthase